MKEIKIEKIKKKKWIGKMISMLSKQQNEE